MWFSRRRKPAPTKLVGDTVGLDHIPMRGVTPPPAPERRGVTVTDYDACQIVTWPSWAGWRSYRRNRYLFGEVDDGWTFNTMQKGARDAFLPLVSEYDFAWTRLLMRDAGMAVNPFDTITPERIIANE